MSYTTYAPNYGFASQFRLCYCNGYLFFDYRDSTYTPRTLRCDLREGRVAWSVDTSNCSPFTTHYAVEQQEGTLTGGSNAAYALLAMGLANGNVDKQTKLTNDNVNNNSNGTGINCVVQTSEWDGGQQEVNGLWRDPYVDALAPNGYNATPMALGAASGNTTAVSPYSFRRLSQVPQDPGTTQRFCGTQITWTDTF